MSPLTTKHSARPRARRGTGVRTLLGPAVLGACMVAVVAMAAGAFVAGLSGLGAAALGAGLVLGFLLVGQLPVTAAARGRRGVGALLLLAGYSLRIWLVLVAFTVVSKAGEPDRQVLGLSVIAVALGWTAGTVWSWSRWKPPVVDVELPHVDRKTASGCP